MTRLDRIGLLRNPAVRRFTVETLGLMILVVACFDLLIAPHLQSLYPALFPQPMVDTTGKELPKTRLGWTRLGVLLVVSGPFVYYRLQHTELGRTVTDFVESETGRR